MSLWGRVVLSIVIVLVGGWVTRLLGGGYPLSLPLARGRVAGLPPGYG